MSWIEKLPYNKEGKPLSFTTSASTVYMDDGVTVLEAIENISAYGQGLGSINGKDSIIDIDTRFAVFPGDIDSENELRANYNLDSIDWQQSTPPVTKTYPNLWKRVVTTIKLGVDDTNPRVKTTYEFCGSLGEAGIDGTDTEWIFYLSKSSSYDGDSLDKWYLNKNLTNAKGKSYNDLDFVPDGWYDDPLVISEEFPYQYTSKRRKINGEWTLFSKPAAWGVRGADGAMFYTNNLFCGVDEEKLFNLDELPTPENVYLDLNTKLVKIRINNLSNIWKDNIEPEMSGKIIYMLIGHFSSTNGECAALDGPIKITGTKGDPGSDGEGIEFVYCTTPDADVPPTDNLEQLFEKLNESSSVIEDDSRDVVWRDRAGDCTEFGAGIPYMWATYRLGTYDPENKNGHYGWQVDGNGNMWQPPFVFNHWGADGIDGNGLEFVFIASTSETIAPTIKYGPGEGEGYDNPSEEYKQKNEFLPWSKNTSDFSLYNGDQITDIPEGGDSDSINMCQNISGTWKRWCDDMPKINEEYRFVWASQRRYIQVGGDPKNKEWSTFSAPKLWTRYALDGHSNILNFINESDYVYFNLKGFTDVEVPDYIKTKSKNYVGVAVDKNGVTTGNITFTYDNTNVAIEKISILTEDGTLQLKENTPTYCKLASNWYAYVELIKLDEQFKLNLLGAYVIPQTAPSTGAAKSDRLVNNIMRLPIIVENTLNNLKASKVWKIIALQDLDENGTIWRYSISPNVSQVLATVSGSNGVKEETTYFYGNDGFKVRITKDSAFSAWLPLTTNDEFVIRIVGNNLSNSMYLTTPRAGRGTYNAETHKVINGLVVFELPLQNDNPNTLGDLARNLCEANGGYIQLFVNDPDYETMSETEAIDDKYYLVDLQPIAALTQYQVGGGQGKDGLSVTIDFSENTKRIGVDKNGKTLGEDFSTEMYVIGAEYRDVTITNNTMPASLGTVTLTKAETPTLNFHINEGIDTAGISGVTVSLKFSIKYAGEDCSVSKNYTVNMNVPGKDGTDSSEYIITTLPTLLVKNTNGKVKSPRGDFEWDSDLDEILVKVLKVVGKTSENTNVPFFVVTNYDDPFTTNIRIEPGDSQNIDNLRISRDSASPHDLHIKVTNPHTLNKVTIGVMDSDNLYDIEEVWVHDAGPQGENGKSLEISGTINVTSLCDLCSHTTESVGTIWVVNDPNNASGYNNHLVLKVIDEGDIECECPEYNGKVWKDLGLTASTSSKLIYYITDSYNKNSLDELLTSELKSIDLFHYNSNNNQINFPQLLTPSDILNYAFTDGIITEYPNSLRSDLYLWATVVLFDGNKITGCLHNDLEIHWFIISGYASQGPQGALGQSPRIRSYSSFNSKEEGFDSPTKWCFAGGDTNDYRQANGKDYLIDRELNESGSPVYYDIISVPIYGADGKITDTKYFQCSLTGIVNGLEHNLATNALTSKNTVTGVTLATFREADAQYDFAYIKSLVADTVVAKSTFSNRVLITDGISTDTPEIVAGMFNGKPDETDGSSLIASNESDVRIFAGTNGDVQVDDAPFRVYKDGSLYAERATIKGDVSAQSLGMLGDGVVRAKFKYFSFAITDEDSLDEKYGNGGVYLGIYLGAGNIEDDKNWLWLPLSSFKNLLGASQEDLDALKNRTALYLKIKNSNLVYSIGDTTTLDVRKLDILDILNWGPTKPHYKVTSFDSMSLNSNYYYNISYQVDKRTLLYPKVLNYNREEIVELTLKLQEILVRLANPSNVLEGSEAIIDLAEFLDKDLYNHNLVFDDTSIGTLGLSKELYFMLLVSARLNHSSTNSILDKVLGITTIGLLSSTFLFGNMPNKYKTGTSNITSLDTFTYLNKLIDTDTQNTIITSGEYNSLEPDLQINFSPIVFDEVISNPLYYLNLEKVFLQEDTLEDGIYLFPVSSLYKSNYNTANGSWEYTIHYNVYAICKAKNKLIYFKFNQDPLEIITPDSSIDSSTIFSGVLGLFETSFGKNRGRTITGIAVADSKYLGNQINGFDLNNDMHFVYL